MKLRRTLKWATGAFLFGLISWVFATYWISTNDCERVIPAGAERMKAIRYCEYGEPDVLEIVEVEKPMPKENEVLVKVRAASLNFIDSPLVRGQWALRLLAGLRKPKFTDFGRDFAGVIEAVGNNITGLKPGDEVFGEKRGSVAEYVCVRHDRLATKPANITFEQAGAVSHAGVTALQGLRTGKIHAGQKVLINGASGGVGTFALQIAKALNAEVTAVVSTRNMEIARALGADHVIDYTKEDFTKREERYDLVLDNVNNRSMSERRRILKSDGICVLAGIGSAGPDQGQMGRIARGFGAAMWNKKFVRYTTTFARADEDLKFLGDLMAQGKMTPFVEKTYPMAETVEALRNFNQGHTRGKLVVVIGDGSTISHEATETNP